MQHVGIVMVLDLIVRRICIESYCGWRIEIELLNSLAIACK